MAARQTVIGKHALVLIARGDTEIASQIFVYDHMREIRIDIKNFEVKVLMNYDEAYFRVFSVKPHSEAPEDQEKAKEIVLKFYNDLVNASIKLTPEEAKHLKKQQEEARNRALEKQQEQEKSNENNEEKPNENNEEKPKIS